MFEDTYDTLPAGYGEHAMERQDTNNPRAFPGNVTDADPITLRTPADAGGGLVPHTSMYGATFSFQDPASPAYAYTVDLETGFVRIDRAPPERSRSVGTLLRSSNKEAYDAIIALAKRQPQAAQAAQAARSGGGGWQQVAEAGSRFIDAYTSNRFPPPSPTSMPSGVALESGALPVSSPPPSTGVPWWVWAAGAVVVGVVVWGATKGGGSSGGEDDE
jgi:hypothetical protein